MVERTQDPALPEHKFVGIDSHSTLHVWAMGSTVPELSPFCPFNGKWSMDRIYYTPFLFVDATMAPALFRFSATWKKNGCNPCNRSVLILVSFRNGQPKNAESRSSSSQRTVPMSQVPSPLVHSPLTSPIFPRFACTVPLPTHALLFTLH